MERRIDRRFDRTADCANAGVGVTDPPVAVFADTRCKAVVAFIALVTFVTFVTFVTLIAFRTCRTGVTFSAFYAIKPFFIRQRGFPVVL